MNYSREFTPEGRDIFLYSRTESAALCGLEGFLVQVETDIGEGLPHVEMVGALSAETKEARERVRTALKNSGINIPAGRLTINLSPADRHKEGASFDLAIAAGLLLALGLVPAVNLDEAVLAGEVGLDGTVHGIRGVMAMAFCAKKESRRRFYVPRMNAEEASVADGLEVIPVDSITHLIDILKSDKITQVSRPAPWTAQEPDTDNDFSQIGGQASLKRAAEVACAGMHNLLMIGSAGSGKSMVAKRIPSILPPLTRQESIEVSTVYSVAGYLEDGKLIRQRPFRSPHHTVTAAGLAGGGRIPQPGEISLAHRGVLFLDELPEFRPGILEILRQPMEDHRLTIVRSGVSYEFPADFMLVAAMNPCRCGFYPDRSLCRCTEGEVQAYLGRISRPLLDRIDMCAEISRASYEDLQSISETSAQIRARVVRAVAVQTERYAGTQIHFNGRVPASALRLYCPTDESADRLLRQLYTGSIMSVRGLHSLIRVARTIADLEGKEVIGSEHIGEAVFYRGPQEKLWDRKIRA